MNYPKGHKELYVETGFGPFHTHSGWGFIRQPGGVMIRHGDGLTLGRPHRDDEDGRAIGVFLDDVTWESVVREMEARRAALPAEGE